jgi:hypothetical protein
VPRVRNYVRTGVGPNDWMVIYQAPATPLPEANRRERLTPRLLVSGVRGLRRGWSTIPGDARVSAVVCDLTSGSAAAFLQAVQDPARPPEFIPS